MTCIAILARAPRPGEAKTRLIPQLGARGAARLQGWLLARTLRTALAAGLGPVHLWATPAHDDPALLAAIAPLGAGGKSTQMTLHTQPNTDLGGRLLFAAQAAAPRPVLLIGSDCPALTPAHLQQAARALCEHEAVLLPAEDGGYVLLGLRQPEPSLFTGLPWGTDQVLALTRQRLAALGWRHQEPATLWDVDRPEDYARLQRLAPELAGVIAPPDGLDR